MKIFFKICCNFETVSMAFSYNIATTNGRRGETTVDVPMKGDTGELWNWVEDANTLFSPRYKTLRKRTTVEAR
jgi:hypothetical protein